MMRRCADWMMSLGMAGMLLGGVLLVGLIVLVVLLIARVGRSAVR
jgi:hypothetical protein